MSHDYQPSWDYPVLDLDEIVQMGDLNSQEVLDIKAVCVRVREELGPAMGFKDGVEIFFVEPTGLTCISRFREGLPPVVGVFCSGTSSRPVIGVDVVLLQELCMGKFSDFEEELAITLAHELAHAYQESLGLGLDEDAQDGHVHMDEDEAETFARVWVESDRIELERLSSSKHVADVDASPNGSAPAPGGGRGGGVAP